MKKLLFVLLFVLPIMAMCQEYSEKPNFFKEWNKYLSDCNELVPDTINQIGLVNVILLPVKQAGTDKILSYVTQPKDTVWEKCECADYKNYGREDRSYLSIGSTVSTTGYTLGGTLSSGYSNKFYLETSKAVQQYGITRKYICKIKKRKASFDDFYDRWCVEKGLIKMN
jgi:hypothetical protein